MLAVAINVWYDKDGNLSISTVGDTVVETKIPLQRFLPPPERVPFYVDSFWTDLQERQDAEYRRES